MRILQRHRNGQIEERMKKNREKRHNWSSKGTFPHYFYLPPQETVDVQSGELSGENYQAPNC